MKIGARNRLEGEVTEVNEASIVEEANRRIIAAMFIDGIELDED